MTKKKTYDNDSISSLKGADRVRKRPGVIFGSDGLEGCEHAMFEILSNAIDEARAGYGRLITVTRFADLSIQVEDQGRGCPVDWNEKEGRYNWELVFCELYAGGKYDNENSDNYEYSLGLNGLGSCATQYASRYMDVTVCRDGKEYRLHFERGEIAGEMALKILNGEPCENMDVITDSPMTYCFDETVMKRFGISRSMLPDDAKIINHEETFMEQYGKVIRITSVIGGIMVLFIIWLVRDNMHKRKVNDTISSLNKKLNFMARYDALTALLNRRVFMEDLQYRIREKEPFGLIMFDMDNFKRVNDVYGHNEGDAVLKEMAARAGALVDDVFEVYRLAGDEFVAIVQSGQKEVIDSYAMKILDTFKIPYRIAGGEQYLASSIGIAVYPKDGKNSTEVIAAADHAMYKVKKNGKNSRAFYDAGMEKEP